MAPHRLRRTALHLPTRRSERDLLYFHNGLLVLLCHKRLGFMAHDRTKNSNEFEEVRVLEF